MASTLGTGFFQPQARPGGVTITQQTLADEIAPFMKDYLERESALASLRSEGLRDEEGELVLDDAGQPIDPGGYKAYTGQTIAEFTPEQLAAQSGLTSLAGFETTIDPVTGERTIERTGPGLSGTRFQDAEALIRGQGEEFTGDVAERFMSPFQQAVIDIEKREAQQKFEQEVLPKLQAAQIGAGSFGGSRGAILEAEAMRGQQQLLGDIQAKGLQSAYNTGLKAFEQQKARERGEATALMGLSPAQLGQQTRELQGLEKVGAVQQQQTQSALDELYKEFLEEQAFPEQVLDRMQGAAFGFPNLRQEVKQSPTTFGPSPFQNLATNVGALGTGVGNLFGQLGGKTAKRHGGVVSRREGGLVPLIRRQISGQTSGELGENEDGLTYNSFGKRLTRLSPVGQGPKNIDALMSRRRRSRADEDAARRSLLEKQQSIIDNRSQRAEAAAQARLDREGKRRDPFGLGFNTTALFRMLSAAGRGDPERPQLEQIGVEGQKIAAERMATDEKFASEAALRQEALQSAQEDFELTSDRESMLSKAARSKEDTALQLELEKLDIQRAESEARRQAALKDKTKYISASEFTALRKEIGQMEGLGWDEENQTLVLQGGASLDSKKGFELSVKLLDSLKGFKNKNSDDFQDSLLITLKSKAENLMANYNIGNQKQELTDQNLNDLAKLSPQDQKEKLKIIVESGDNSNLSMEDIPTIMRIIKIRSAK